MATTWFQVKAQLLAIAFCLSVALAYNNGERGIAHIVTTYVVVAVVTLLLSELVNQRAERRLWVEREVARAQWERESRERLARYWAEDLAEDSRVR